MASSKQNYKTLGAKPLQLIETTIISTPIYIGLLTKVENGDKLF